MIYLLIPILFVLFIYLGLKKPGIAMITCPVFVISLIAYGSAENEPVMLISAIVLFVLTIIAILFSRSEPDQTNWPKHIVKFLLYISLSILLLVVLFTLSTPLGFFGIVFAVFTIGSILAYFVTTKQATAAYVVSTIGSSIRQNLPLPMALESAASGQKDNRSKILLRIKRWLVQGFPLSESIKKGYSNCPGSVIAMIAAAEKINQLPMAIEALEANMTAQAKERRKIRPVHPIYPVLVMTFMFFILVSIMTFIMPQFSTSLTEMTENWKLPAITRFFLDITRYLIADSGLVLLIIIAIVVLVIIPASIYIWFRPRKTDEPYMLSILGDKIKWHLPVLHWFERNYSMVHIIEMLRLSLNAGSTVNDAIANTISLDVNYCFKTGLRKWLKKVESGENISKSAEQSGLGTVLAWAFDDKVNQGNTLSILETLESFYLSNYSYSVNLARFIMWPCIIVLMGAIVFLVLLSVFLPGISIINNLVSLI
jgi:type II secretory pathway component PulF